MKLFKRNKSEIEFKGVSVSNEKRDAIVLFAAEAVIVLVFIVGVVFALNYFGIINLSGINSTLFGRLPVQEEEENNPLEVFSTIPGYTVSISDKEKLMQLLNEWGVFGKEYESTLASEGSTAGVPVSKIVLRFTDKEQKGNIYTNPNSGVYLSSYTYISPGVLDVNIQIARSILNEPNFINKLGDYARTQFIVTLYKLANRTTNDQEFYRREKEIDEILTRERNNKTQLFSVEKL